MELKSKTGLDVTITSKIVGGPNYVETWISFSHPEVGVINSPIARRIEELKGNNVIYFRSNGMITGKKMAISFDDATVEIIEKYFDPLDAVAESKMVEDRKKFLAAQKKNYYPDTISGKDVSEDYY